MAQVVAALRRARLFPFPVYLFPAFPSPVFLDRAFLFGLGGARGEALEINFESDDVAHLFLEFVHGESSVEDDEIITLDHVVVALENARLKKTKAFGAVVGKAEVHASFVVFEFRAAA